VGRLSGRIETARLRALLPELEALRQVLDQDRG
jgi:hypothetical protein